MKRKQQATTSGEDYLEAILESVLKPSHCVKNDDVIEWEHEET